MYRPHEPFGRFESKLEALRLAKVDVELTFVLLSMAPLARPPAPLQTISPSNRPRQAIRSPKQRCDPRPQAQLVG